MVLEDEFVLLSMLILSKHTPVGEVFYPNLSSLIS
jgi:hypothetical protein